MGCSNCSTGGSSSPKGCGSKGSCSTGGCNKLNSFDWLSQVDLPDYGNYDLVEVSFKSGARKDFFRKPEYVHVHTGDFVAVESSSSGYDIGKISLSGELVKLQLRKQRKKEDAILPNIIRAANQRDLERLSDARASEREAMIRARVIVRDLQLDMKIGDVEYQGDKRKITFYYTAEGRVDFRELIRVFAKEYKVKIEMRQIGARQESARIGGIGSCGRELCCSTWLTDFKSVSTVAARYQNLAINQSKLSGQCGRLKCCLNYELNTYLEVLQEFPKNVNLIKTKKGNAVLIKTDIFKRLMFFGYKTDFGISEIQALSIDQVKELNELNKKGDLPENLRDVSIHLYQETEEEDKELSFVDGAGSLELKNLGSIKKRGKKKKKPRNKNASSKNKDKQQNTRNRSVNKNDVNSGQPKKDDSKKDQMNDQKKPSSKNKNRNRNRNRRKNKNPNSGNNNSNNNGNNNKG
jgi:cell fate regulator YaaT (PSP1 superfamily)